MNLAKIAKMAGVSVSTVSKAFSDSKEISAETKAEIFEIARNTGCFEKYYKPKYSKKLIAVICPELQGVHYSQMVTHIEKTVTERGDTILISYSNFSGATQKELIDYFAKFACVDGIVVIEPVEKIEIASEIPIVQIGLTEGAANVHKIDVDINDAFDKSIKLLKSYGHSKIGFVGEKFTKAEYGVFEKYMKKNLLEIEPGYVSVNDKRFFECGYSGMEEILKKGNVPTAVYAAYSHVAEGIIKCLEDKKIKMPEEMSVICMDDINCVPYRKTDLSCIKMHIEELCSEAIRLLYRSFEPRYGNAKLTVTVKREFHHGKTIFDRRGKEMKA